MVKFKVVDSLEEIPTFDQNLPVFADIESDGLYINTRLIQLFQPQASDLVYIIDTDILDLQEAKDFIKPLWTVWYNASYDFGTLNMTTDRFDDLIYLTKSAYPQWMEFALDKVLSKFGLDGLYANLDKKQMQKSYVIGAYLSQQQLLYAATDVVAISKLWEDPNIQQYRDVLAYKVDILSMKYAIEYQENGLEVDQTSVMKELDDVQAKIDVNSVILDNVREPYGYDAKKAWTGLNCNSPKQVKAVLGTDSSDKATLIRLIAEDNTIAKAVYEQRRLIKRRTFLISYNYPKVYTRFNVAGAVTGRFTATGGDLPRGINSQQITRDLQYLFNEDTEDTTVIECDFGTAELRAACSIMKEEVMYNELKAGIDLHKVSASMATGKPIEDITKADRQKGKAVSFGFIFGMSAASFQEFAFLNYGVTFTLAEAQAIKAKYSKHYPAINRYHQAAWNNYKKPSYVVRTALGRRAKPKLGTDAINIPTQGTIGETTKLAVHYILKEAPEMISMIYNVVHDQINARVPNTRVDHYREIMVRNMQKAWEEICKCDLMHYKDIPMPVDAEHSQAA